MRNVPAVLLDVKCQRYIWYYKLGIVNPHIKIFNWDKQVTEALKDGINVVRRGLQFETVILHGVFKLDNGNYSVIYFGKRSNAEIQLAMKYTSLRQCLVFETGEVIKFNELKASKYLDDYNRTDRPERISWEQCPQSCAAYGVCREGEIPTPQEHSMAQDGWSDYYNPELFDEVFTHIEKGEYEEFIDGPESFSGKPCLAGKPLTKKRGDYG